MIGLCGSHRTGKTTLARAYSVQHETPFIETSTGAVFARLGLDPKADYDFIDRMHIQHEILAHCAAKWREAPSQFITDRTPIDMLAYTLADVQRTNVSEKAAKLARQYIDDCFLMTARHFSTLIVVQPGIPLVESETSAPANIAYIEHINSLVLGLVADERQRVERVFIPRASLDLQVRVDAVHWAAQRSYARTIQRYGQERFVH